jgi:hypothetical protein
MQDYPSVQPTAAVRLELEGPIFVMLEDWRRAQSKIPSRSEAVRLLLAHALSARPNQCDRATLTDTASRDADSLSARTPGPRPPEMRIPSTPSRVTMKTVQPT